MINSSESLFLAVTFILAAIISSVATYLVRNLVRRRGWISQPASHHIHRARVPRLGGVAIYATFMLLYTLSIVSGMNPGWQHQLRVVVPASLVFVVGVIDDFRKLPARLKLTFQIASGVMLFAAGVHLINPASIHLQVFSWHLGPVISFVATLVWVILITNAFNLIDGLDGLAAGSALFSIITLFGLALVEHDIGTAFAALALGGTVLGFLRYNFNPATIFLGDGGSLFLGFMLAGLALQPSRAAGPTLVAVAIPLVSFGLPVVETAVSVVRRFLGGKPLFAPDQDHIHHRLLRMGLSHRKAVIALYGICAACALLSFFLMYPGRGLVGLVLLVVGIMFCWVIDRVDYAEFREFTRIAQRTLEQKRVIANNVIVRNAANMLETSTSWSDVTCALDSLLEGGEFDTYVLLLSDSIAVYGGPRKSIGSAKAIGTGRNREPQRNRKSASWEVRMDLHTADSTVVGQLTVGRVFRRRSLLLDLNLLLNELQPALSVACERLQNKEHKALKISLSATTAPGLVEPAPALMADSVCGSDYLPS